MIERKVVISNTEGIDARTAAVVAYTANQFSSGIWMQKDEMKINGKSIMGIISLALAQGDEIIVLTDGKDEEKMIDEIEKILSLDSE